MDLHTFNDLFGPYDPWGAVLHFLVESDPRPAREQFNERYAHGGGWRPMKGFTATKTGLKYPGDPIFKRLVTVKFRDETISMHDCALVSITQPDGSFEVSRMD